MVKVSIHKLGGEEPFLLAQMSREDCAKQFEFADARYLRPLGGQPAAPLVASHDPELVIFEVPSAEDESDAEKAGKSSNDNPNDKGEAVNIRDELVANLPRLRAFAISLCGPAHQADDLVQETLLKALANQDKFEAGTNLRAWLFAILRNAYFSIHRKRRREVEDVDGKITASLVAAPTQDNHVELHELRSALMLLPDAQREALLLVGAAGYSFKEAAAVAGCAVGTMKSRASRARTRLTKGLGFTDAEPEVDPVDLAPRHQRLACESRVAAQQDAHRRPMPARLRKGHPPHLHSSNHHGWTGCSVGVGGSPNATPG